MKRWDRRALEGLPLRLLIMSLLVSLAFPAVASSMEGFERSTAHADLVFQGKMVSRCIEEVMSEGEGNRKVITVKVPIGHDLAMEIGGPLAEPSSLSVRCLGGGTTIEVIALGAPPARTTTPGGSGLLLDEGDHTLSVECIKIDHKLVVQVRSAT
jgi:hypothetical protein